MSTYSHLSIIKTRAGKNRKDAGKRKDRKQAYAMAKPVYITVNGNINAWYSSKAYPVLD